MNPATPRPCPRCGSLMGHVDPTFDDMNRLVIVGGEVRKLAPMAWDALFLLRERFGRPVSRDSMMRRLYGAGDMPGDRTVDQYMHELRRAIEGSPYRIVNRYRLGWTLSREEA